MSLPEQKNIEQLNSIKLAINAKLQYSAELKIYDSDENNALARITKLAKVVEDMIKVKNQEEK